MHLSSVSANFSYQLERVLAAVYGINEGWEPILELNDITVSRKVMPDGRLFVRSKFASNLSSNEIVNFLRPEAASLENPYCANILGSCKILHTLAPGDCICALTFKSWVASWMRLLYTADKGESISAMLAGEESDQMAPLIMRLISRQNFPWQGAATILRLEIANSWISASGLLANSGVVLQPLKGDPTKTLVSEVWDVQNAPQHVLKPVFQKLCSTLDFKSYERIPQQILCEKFGYMVIACKKCCRGPPLTPKLSISTDGLPFEEVVEAIEWERPIKVGLDFALSEYLKHLLALVGVHPSVICGTLDGMQLLSYQAAVRRSLWPSLSQVLQPIMTKQKSAYRRHHGGTGAPFLQADVEPRFSGVVVPVPDLMQSCVRADGDYEFQVSSSSETPMYWASSSSLEV